MKKQLLSALAVFALTGCSSNNSGCTQADLQPEVAAPKPEAQDLEARVYKDSSSWMIIDHCHDCEYVVVASHVFCWRGTNLLYTMLP